MNFEIYNKIVDFIVETCDVERGDITPDSDIIHELKIDSIMLVEVVFDVEEEYGISVPLDEWQEDESGDASEQRFKMSAFVDAIEQLVEAKKSGAPQPLPIYKRHLESEELT